jgi:N-dimethylarginine dimethylaminohydrolase
MQEENVFVGEPIDRALAAEQHADLCAVLNPTIARFPARLPNAVFVANAALVLPRLPSVAIISSMMHSNRKSETLYATKCLQQLGYKTYPFPTQHVFEGQGEAKWFHDGHVLVVGYGYRSSAASVTALRRLLIRIYNEHRVIPPRVVGVQLQTPSLYHLDIAMLKLGESRAIVHDCAFNAAGLKKLRAVMSIVSIRVHDPFCLNAVRFSGGIVTHKLHPDVRRLLRSVTRSTIIEVDVSEFEKTGGSIRCMILDL